MDIPGGGAPVMKLQRSVTVMGCVLVRDSIQYTARYKVTHTSPTSVGRRSFFDI